jgi:hypothetical protein
LRTAPAVNEPGRYPTCYVHDVDFSAFVGDSARQRNIDVNGLSLLGWTAITILQQRGFRLGSVPTSATERITEDVPSVLAQQAVASQWSGSLITERTGARIEGVKGFGDRFMMSQQRKEELPDEVWSAVAQLQRNLQELIGPISMEWAHDGTTLWILQLHQELSAGSENVVVPGDADSWCEFDVSQGLQALRKLAEAAAASGCGIEFKQGVALTSHAAAIVRKKGIPARVRVES